MTSGTITEAERAGAAIYGYRALRIYDFVVLRVSNSLVWRCPSRRMLASYDAQVSGDHLDIGPGSGWFLREARFPVGETAVTLVDLNPAALEMSTQRLLGRGIEPSCRIGSVVRPLPVERRYRSVAANLVMHCVPGGWAEKGVAFRHIADVMAADGVFFGSTVLARGVRQHPVARWLIRFYNRAGAFQNASDDRAGLEAALRGAFAEVKVVVVGSVALWEARAPRGAAEV
ncbi:methyltransferase domain-containing protein [Nocardia huaxiensis]|uniref:Methyltransferase domain-containing protein n=1 Tax=Nocardia huaxiensis TaxID=2755382 RepID=A0A7D6VJJ7_9NOCA|nr:class I SAM-dependent methyltransferase [Nocardia huaxiensis]QLY30970.1 methyltransferase domain-containing protein [Nocardia huaxiensis]